MSGGVGGIPAVGAELLGESGPPEKMDKSLQKENKKLKGDIKQMEMKIKAMQVELTKSLQMKERLEGLCRELQKQNKYIRAESSAKIQEANARGKELASEVQNNMGFMKSINDNLAAISSESLAVKKENEDLCKKIGILKGHYEEREVILQEALKETHESLQKARLELSETKVKNAEEKEKLILEMKKLTEGLIQSREQMKDAKKTEIALREMLQGYEDKFKGMEKALKDTNVSYEEFRTEMTNVTGRTKELEKETFKWQRRWEESNENLKKMRDNYKRVQEDLEKSQENLEKMKGLCRSLHVENRGLLTELEGEAKEKIDSLNATAKETLKEINAGAAGLAEEMLSLVNAAEASSSARAAQKASAAAETVEAAKDQNGNPESETLSLQPPKTPEPEATSSSPTTGGDSSVKGKKNKKKKGKK